MEKNKNKKNKKNKHTNTSIKNVEKNPASDVKKAQDVTKALQEQRERQRQLQLKKLEEIRMEKLLELEQQQLHAALKESMEHQQNKQNKQNKQTSSMISDQKSEYEKAVELDLARQKKEEEDLKLAEPTKEFLRELRMKRFEGKNKSI